MMTFNDTGTLSHWQLDDIQVIEPLHSKGNSLRGGAYLCIPNFEELSPPFNIKHGEYRITPCDKQLPHRKNLVAPAENNWGQIDVLTDWEEKEDSQGKTLTVTTTLRALSDSTWVRPGFHPYFSVTKNTLITIGETLLAVADLPHDNMQAYPTSSLGETATLATDNYHVSVGCQVSAYAKDLILAFVVWSDKKHQYVCIEPVIGIQPTDDCLPKPFMLVKGEELIMAFTILASKKALVI